MPGTFPLSICYDDSENPDHFRKIEAQLFSIFHWPIAVLRRFLQQTLATHVHEVKHADNLCAFLYFCARGFPLCMVRAAALIARGIGGPPSLLGSLSLA
jgi:hypothetical protein